MPGSIAPTGTTSRLDRASGPGMEHFIARKLCQQVSLLGSHGGKALVGRASEVDDRVTSPVGSLTAPIRNVGSYLLRRIPADGLLDPALDIPTRAHTKRVSHTRPERPFHRSSRFLAERPGRSRPRTSSVRRRGRAMARPARPTPANADMVLITPGANAR